MKKINRKYLFANEDSETILKTAEERNFFSNQVLSIKTFDNITLLPPKFKSWRTVPMCIGGGVDEQNNYVEETATINFNIYRMYGSYQYDSEKVKYSDETVFFSGFYVQQWGHFLLECISRFYPIIQNPEKYKDMKIIFLPMRENDEINGTFLELLNLIGIMEEQIVILREPTRYKKIIVPEPSLNTNIFWTKEYETIINHIVEKAMGKPVKIKTHKKIYLSRKNWALSYDRDIGEDKIERFFNKNGFKSVSMEKHSLVEQIHILQGADHVASAICTLPHNLLFARDGIKSAIINKMPRYNSSQFQIDDFKNIDATYIDGYLALFSADCGIGPFLFDVNENLINYAKDNGMKLPKREARKDDIIKYLDLCFEKIDNLSDRDLYELRNLYKIMRTRFHFYSKRELFIKKYFYKVLSMIIKGKNKYFYNRYIEYKNRLKEYKKVMF